MATSTEQITDLISGYTDLKGYFEGQKPQWDAGVADAQAAYAALSGNLKGVIGTQMLFTAIVDPDELAPTNVRGGTFNTLKALVDAAPRGSTVISQGVEGAVINITEHIELAGKRLVLQTQGAANAVTKAIYRFNAFDDGVSNYLYHIACDDGASVEIQYAEVRVLGRADGALPWADSGKFAIGQVAGRGTLSVGVAQCVVTVADGNALMSPHQGCVLSLASFGATVSGAGFVVGQVSTGVVLVSVKSMTLSSGAAVLDGGTVGTNVLQS